MVELDNAFNIYSRQSIPVIIFPFIVSMMPSPVDGNEIKPFIQFYNLRPPDPRVRRSKNTCVTQVLGILDAFEGFEFLLHEIVSSFW